MRTILLSLAGAVSALAVAAPASAQWAPAPSPYGYGTPAYGYGYNGYGAVNLQARVARVRQQIFMLQRQRLIGHEQAERLNREARAIERQAAYGAYGVDPYRMQVLSARVGQLEQRVQYAASRGSRYGYGAYGNGYGYSPYGYNNGYNNGYYGRGDREQDDGDYDDDGPDR